MALRPAGRSNRKKSRPKRPALVNFDVRPSPAGPRAQVASPRAAGLAAFHLFARCPRVVGPGRTIFEINEARPRGNCRRLGCALRRQASARTIVEMIPETEPATLVAHGVARGQSVNGQRLLLVDGALRMGVPRTGIRRYCHRHSHRTHTQNAKCFLQNHDPNLQK